MNKNWWRDYQARKRARHLLHNGRKLLRMHHDILDAQSVRYMRAVCDDLTQALWERRPHLVTELTDKLEKSLAKAFPQDNDSGWRENVEVFLVAAIVAMAIRSFFVQPFKIPTGSMQPTLYGLHEAQVEDRRASLVKRLTDCAILGQWPTDDRAKPAQGVMNFLGWLVTGRWPPEARSILRGDHIFVDRFTYHFREPQRGDVVVFDTNDIYKDLTTKFNFGEYEKAQLYDKVANKFYIKRLVAIGGDRVQIEPPHVRVNDQILDSRVGFKRIYSCQDGYHGYVTPGAMPPPCYLGTPSDVYQVPEKKYFVMGDNSRSSYDGRFWGAFPRRALIGRAFVVYWPFTKRFGFVE